MDQPNGPSQVGFFVGKHSQQQKYCATISGLPNVQSQAVCAVNDCQKNSGTPRQALQLYRRQSQRCPRWIQLKRHALTPQWDKRMWAANFRTLRRWKRNAAVQPARPT